MPRYFNTPEEDETASGKAVRKDDKRTNNKKDKNADYFEFRTDDLFEGKASIPAEKLKKYTRTKSLDPHGIKSKSHKDALIKTDKKYRQSIQQAARAELLLPEEEGFLEVDDNEDTYRVKQHEIASEVDITSSSKLFSLSLTDFGPYKINYFRDGRHLLFGGHKGHVAAMDWLTKRLLCEINVMESIHDICWLHIPTMYAVAQKEWVYIYDTQGIELHCVKKLNKVLQMEFLPYHFLLATASEKGYLSWLDVSIGKMTAEIYTKAGRLNIMCQNPYNAVLLTGHPNGSVSMWSPNVNVPLVRMLCHPHPIRALCVDSQGLYMATASIDHSLKIWDVRTYKCLQSFKLRSAAGFLNFSQRGLLSVGSGNIVEVYKDPCSQDVKTPYMRHKVDSTISSMQFCPYEDVLGIGHNQGFNSILIPGSGEPNFDTFESNPFMTKNQRREMEVKSLLEKIQPELITLDPSHLGSVNIPTLKEKMEAKKALLYVKPKDISFEPKAKTKGRNKQAKVYKRKSAVIEAHRREHVKQKIKEKQINPTPKDVEPHASSCLERFRKNKNVK